MPAAIPYTAGAVPLPPAVANDAPKSAPKKPKDNSAAKKAPEATLTAVNSTFGDVPKHTIDKQADNAPKAPAIADSKPAAAGSAPKVNITGTDTTPPSNQIVPDSVNPVAAHKGQPVKTPDGRSVVLDKLGNPIAINPDGSQVADPKGHPYAVDQTGKYVETEDGMYGVYDRKGHVVASDPATGTIIADKDGNAYAVRLDGKYAKAGSKDVVYHKDFGDNPVAVDPGTGAQELAYPGGPALAVDVKNGAFINTPDGKLVAWSKEANGNPVAIDPATNAQVTDAYGNPLALDGNGKYLTTPDGKDVVYDKDNGGSRAFVDPATGKIAVDANGNPYMITPAGSYAQAAGGNYVVYDKANGNHPVAIDSITGEAVKDDKGHILAIDDNGEYIKTPQGNAVAYNKVNNKVNLVATGDDGNPLVLGGYPAAVDKYGNYLKTPDGKGIVYDGKGNMVALDKDGKVATDGSGNPLAVDRNGDFEAGLVYDKTTGFRILDPSKNNVNIDSRLVAVDVNGKVITDESGNTAVYDDMGKPVFKQDMKTPDGLQIYKDAKTGELEVSIQNGPVYKVDAATNDIAKDAGGYLPALYDPVNSNETRPPVMPNEKPDTMINQLPQGGDRGDPMKIKGELFDKNGNLSNENLYKALATYDARDVYDALINAGNAGGWNNMNQSPATIHPDESMAKQAIAALIAWQNENGKYNPVKDGKVPAIVFEDRPPWETQNANRGSNSVVVNISINRPISATVFQGLNKLKMSDTFGNAYNGSGNPSLDTVAEYLANNWTGDQSDMKGELILKWEFRKLDNVVLQLGNGDRNAGLDKLKRAYYTGDPVAIRELNKHLSEWHEGAGQ